MHSIWYRNPSKYKGKKVLVVGGGSSGRDISREVSTEADETLWSVRGFVRDDEPNPRVDGTRDEGFDRVLLATGFEIE